MPSFLNGHGQKLISLLAMPSTLNGQELISLLAVSSIFNGQWPIGLLPIGRQLIIQRATV